MRHRQTIRVISLIVMVCFLTVSCASMSATMAENPALCTITGAVLVGGLGAVLGALGGGKKGAAIGAGAGAAAGALVAAAYCFKMGPFESREVKGYEETRSATNYQADQGDVVQITRYSLTPAAIAPGNLVVLNATYSVMAPNPNQEVPITETRILKRFNPAKKTYEELGRVDTPVTVKPGTRQADGKFPVPSGTPVGQYVVVLVVTKDRQRDAKELPLIVTTNQAMLQRSSSRMTEVLAESGKAGATSTAPSTSSDQSVVAPQPTPGPGLGGEAQPGVPPTPAEIPLAAIGEKDPKAPPQVASVPAPGTETAKVTTEKPRYFVASKVSGKGSVREGPGKHHKIVGEIAEKDRYLIAEETKDPGGVWYKIRLDSGIEAWVAASLGIEVQE